MLQPKLVGPIINMVLPEQVILVDENDRAVGVGEKLVTHRTGALHRAFSVFVFDRARRLLLQQRAATKYHSQGLWSNTCCGHPRPGEEITAAAHRRLREEMNIECELRAAFNFLYRAELAGQLIEHEYDHVFVGEYDRAPVPEPKEVADWKWLSMAELRQDLSRAPERYSYWLKAAIEGPEWRRLNALLRVE
ncbi:MAG: isopentenyl-diphosphate Delta-isomerase [Pyrinomonadaceae bacterium]